MVVAYKEMRAAIEIALEKAIIFEKEMGGGIDPPPTLSKKAALSEKQIAEFLAASRARRRIPSYPNDKKP